MPLPKNESIFIRKSKEQLSACVLWSSCSENFMSILFSQTFCILAHIITEKVSINDIFLETFSKFLSRLF